jgi:hypothetical protein
MWRVILSIVAVVFDALLLFLLTIVLLGAIAQPLPAPGPRTVVLTEANSQRARLSSFVGVGVIGAGVSLNLLAIGFGARLRLPRRASRAEVAAEFS